MRARRRTVRFAVLALVLAWSTSPAPAAAQAKKPDPWEPVRFLVGDWRGVAKGEAGEGTVRRTYEFIIKGRYILEKNVSTYPPQAPNPSGEVHEHWSILSYDRTRHALVLRQFPRRGSSTNT